MRIAVGDVMQSKDSVLVLHGAIGNTEGPQLCGGNRLSRGVKVDKYGKHHF